MSTDARAAGSGRSLAAGLEHVPLERLRSFSALYREYVSRFDGVSEFYARDWRSSDDRLAAVREAAAHPRDRGVLVDVLREQQAAWNNLGPAAAQVERLLDPRSAVVVTGQQVGLFTGPLYTVLKAMTTVRLARHLEAETGHPVVPVFWLGTEDHDLAEMSVASVPGSDGPEQLVYDGHRLPRVGNLGSVGALRLAAPIAALVDRLERLLAGTEFSGPVMDAVRAAYRPGATFTDAFAALLTALLPDSGLVLMSAEDVRLKRLALPLWRREIEDGERLHRALTDVTDRLEGASWHAQVRTAPTNLFLEQGGMRLPIDRDGASYRVRSTDVAFDGAGLLDLLERETGRFTPNVVLRPLTQDWLLPTAAYVAGPGEVAYFAQFRPAYEWAGLPMPSIHPRATVTVVEPRVGRFLHETGLPVEALQEPVDSLFTRLVQERTGIDLEATFATAGSRIDASLAALDSVVSGLDAGLSATVGASSAAMRRELERLRERVLRAQRRRESELGHRLRHAASSVFPRGTPQERVSSPLWFAARFGPGFLPELMESIDVMAPAHQVIHPAGQP